MCPILTLKQFPLSSAPEKPFKKMTPELKREWQQSVENPGEYGPYFSQTEILSFKIHNYSAPKMPIGIDVQMY